MSERERKEREREERRVVITAAIVPVISDQSQSSHHNLYIYMHTWLTKHKISTVYTWLQSHPLLCSHKHPPPLHAYSVLPANPSKLFQVGNSLWWILLRLVANLVVIRLFLAHKKGKGKYKNIHTNKCWKKILKYKYENTDSGLNGEDPAYFWSFDHKHTASCLLFVIYQTTYLRRLKPNICLSCFLLICSSAYTLTG